MSVAKLLRAQAAAIRAEAEARAVALESLADSSEREREQATSTATHEWIPIKSSPLPPTTARRLIREQKVRAVKVGRELRIHAGDVRAFLESAQVRTAEAIADVEHADPFEAARARARSRRAS